MAQYSVNSQYMCMLMRITLIIGFDHACSSTTNYIFLLICLGQYPITLENISVVDLDEVRVDFHLGRISSVSYYHSSSLSPVSYPMIPLCCMLCIQEEYDNLTRLNNISIRARATDTTLETIEIQLDGIETFSSSRNDVYFPITNFNENINYTMFFQLDNAGQSSNISDPFSLCKKTLLAYHTIIYIMHVKNHARFVLGHCKCMYI